MAIHPLPLTAPVKAYCLTFVFLRITETRWSVPTDLRGFSNPNVAEPHERSGAVETLLGVFMRSDQLYIGLLQSLPTYIRKPCVISHSQASPLCSVPQGNPMPNKSSSYLFSATEPCSGSRCGHAATRCRRLAAMHASQDNDLKLASLLRILCA